METRVGQDANGRVGREVSLTDRFRFECKRCARCCYKSEFVLTPYDILRLCHGLKMSTRAFLARYSRIVPDPESGLPVCWLDFGKTQRSQSRDGWSMSCPFLDLQDDDFVCRIYPFRPGRCRLYPLFRSEEDDSEPEYAFGEVRSTAKQTSKKWTVAQWVEYQGLTPYFRQNQQFVVQVQALTEAGRDWPEEFLQLLVKLWYDYSCVKEVETLSEKYERAMRGAALLGDAMIKFYDGRRKTNEDKGS